MITGGIEPPIFGSGIQRVTIFFFFFFYEYGRPRVLLCRNLLRSPVCVPDATEVALPSA